MTSGRLAAAALVLWCWPLAARAQDTGAAEAPAQTADLGELEALLDQSIVTSASRSAERAAGAPATVLTITAEELRVHGIRTIDEALVFLGIGFQSMRPRDYLASQDVGAQGLALRDAGRHVLVLLDGHVLNSQDTGQSTLHEGLGVPLEAIDHLEVLLGPGSVVYGSNAMLAVVHVFTRRAPDQSGLRATAELALAPPQGLDGQPVGLSAPGSQAGLRYRFGVGFARAFTLFGSDAEVRVDLEWLEDLGNSYAVPELVDDESQLYPGQTAWGGTARHGLQAPSAVASLRVGDFRLAVQASHYARGMPLVGTFSDPLSREERSSLRLDLRHSTALDPHLTLSTRFYADLTDWNERSVYTSQYWCLPGQIDGCRFQLASRGRSAGLEQQLVLDWDLDGDVVTTVGYDVRGRDATMRPADYVDRVSLQPPATVRTPYGHVVAPLVAVFAQQVWRPFDWLSFNAGARLDVDLLSEAHLSPRLAVVLAPAQGTSVRVSYAEAFRAPSAYELEEHDLTYRGPARSLAPEVARSVELEWQQRVDWMTFSLRGYAAFYDGFIDSRPLTTEEFEVAYARGEFSPTAEPSYTVRYDNLSTLRAIGGSFSFTARPVEGLSLGASLSIAHTRKIDGALEEPLALVPLWMGNAHAAWTMAPRGATLAIAAYFSGRRIAFDDVLALERQELSEQLDLRVTFTAPLDALPGLSLRTSVSYSLNPFYAFLLSAPSEYNAESPLHFYPAAGSFYGLVGLQYVVDP